MYPKASRRAFCGKLAVAVMTLGGMGAAEEQKSAGKKDETASKVYEVGDDVKPPKLVHYVEPDFSPDSKEAYVEGTVKISTVVTDEGLPTNLHVTSGLNSEQDRTAIEAVKQWRFQPGTKSGQPVNVRVTIEVTFHLL